jgi:hypothetical protein
VDEDEDYSYRTTPPVDPMLSYTVPVAVLVIVVAIVCGLVFGGVIQGHEPRVGPAQAPTTQSTVLIIP